MSHQKIINSPTWPE